MITDAQLLFSNQQADVRSAATYVSTNTVDLGVARDIGNGQTLYVEFTVDDAFTGGTSVQFQVISSAAANLGTPTVLATTPAIVDATLITGYRTQLAVPPVVGNGQRYLGVQYVGVGTHSAGKVSARLVLSVDNIDYYASGFTVA